MIGAVGADEFGVRLRAALTSAGVETAALRTVEGASGTAHITVDDEGANSIIVIPGANASVTGLEAGDDARIGAAGLAPAPARTPAVGRPHAARSPPAPAASVRSSPRRPRGRCPPNSSPPPICCSRTSTRRPPSPAAPIPAGPPRPSSRTCPRW